MYREIEEAALTAWPGLHQVTMDGWLLRAAEGYTRRANSVQPLGPSTRGLAEKVEECERWYAAAQLRCLFRITPFSEPGLEDYLEQRGYVEDGRSQVMVRPLGDDMVGDAEELELTEWIATYARCSRLATPSALAALVSAIPVQRVTTCVRDEGGQVVSVGMGVLDGPVFGLFDLVTDPEARGRGHGRRLIGALLGWARARGAAQAYLQVLESNEGARRLYAGLGFRRAYDYWYRVRPEPTSTRR
jgi:ribosomal protein S18 acetylase RimI-like enzyme